MTIEQVIELVEKWLADSSGVTVEELDAAVTAAWTAYDAWSAAAWAAETAADAEAIAAAAWAAAWAAAYWAADAAAYWADAADAARYVAEYRELTKG